MTSTLVTPESVPSFWTKTVPPLTVKLPVKVFGLPRMMPPAPAFRKLTAPEIEPP